MEAKFITFEGIDGSGKSTVIALLKAKLEAAGFAVMTLQEPGSSELANELRSILADVDREIDPITQVFMLEASRSDMVATVLKPALESQEYDFILCDRFTHSTLAYNSEHVPEVMLNLMNDIATRDIKPDQTYFLDIDIEKAIERRLNRGRSKDTANYINVKSIERQQKLYQLLAKRNHSIMTIINDNSSDTADKLFDELKRMKDSRH